MGMKIYTNCVGHINKMASMPIYDKKIISSSELIG